MQSWLVHIYKPLILYNLFCWYIALKWIKWYWSNVWQQMEMIFFSLSLSFISSTITETDECWSENSNIFHKSLQSASAKWMNEIILFFICVDCIFNQPISPVHSESRNVKWLKKESENEYISFEINLIKSCGQICFTALFGSSYWNFFFFLISYFCCCCCLSSLHHPPTIIEMKILHKTKWSVYTFLSILAYSCIVGLIRNLTIHFECNVNECEKNCLRSERVREFQIIIIIIIVHLWVHTNECVCQYMYLDWSSSRMRSLFYSISSA